MEIKTLERFATHARRELLASVEAQATAVLAAGSVARSEHDRTVKRLEAEIASHGQKHVIDKVAYTWFNRLIALRYMDVRAYTAAGIVSLAPGQAHGQPEILADAKRGHLDEEVVASRGTREAIMGLLEGTRSSTSPEGEAYALLLTEYCRFWNKAMPFMFEREGDYTELLVPSGLLADGAILSRAREVLTEDVCKDVEVIGWLYQFYISERKGEVFAGFSAKGKNRKLAGPEEIPAATQLFTPHWIVRYLVENSLGRIWMLNRPTSRLIDRMDYYIAPVDEETDFLKINGPEELTVIDPACGSGHMLTYAFDLLYVIYEEEGYAPSEIPSLILKHNLHGTEIDPRAGSLAAFTLTMKAAAKRKLFLKNAVEPNICVLDPISFNADELSYLVTRDGDHVAEEDFWNQFAEANTIGSLIQPDPALTVRLNDHLTTLDADGDFFRVDALDRAQRVVKQAVYLSSRYKIAIANPPYMIQRNYGPELSTFVKRVYPRSAADIFAPFVVRCLELSKSDGIVAMITKQTWMFGSSFEVLRDSINHSSPIVSLAHLGTAAFDSINGEVVNTVAFVLDQKSDTTSPGLFVDAREGENEAAKARIVAATASGKLRAFSMAARDFAKIPGGPIAFWAGHELPKVWEGGTLLREEADLTSGISTGDNGRFERMWWEVSRSCISSEGNASFIGTKRWTPAWSGGEFRRWYGNALVVMDWEDGGHRVRAHPGSAVRNARFQGRSGITYTKIGGATFAGRNAAAGYVFDDAGRMIFPDHLVTDGCMLAFLNSSAAQLLLDVLTPGLNYTSTEIGLLPIARIEPIANDLENLAKSLVEIARADWNDLEVSRDFSVPSIFSSPGYALEARYLNWSERWREVATRQGELERKNNELVADALGLGSKHLLNVPLSRVTLSRNVEFRFGRGRSTEEYVTLERAAVATELVSYAVGCMFGRYSLDMEGLILANQGSTLRDYLAKVPSPTFIPGAENVIPIVDGDWFKDDIVERFRQFLRTAFGAKHFDENLRFVEESLGVKSIRDYFIATSNPSGRSIARSKFYDDHVRRYKKRPIYWMFSSPKGSFNALIYLHRYTPATVSTVLNEYLREYRAKLEVGLERAEEAAAGGISVKDQKEADRLRAILAELRGYERDVLYPLDINKVEIDLDDGVLVNYLRMGRALRDCGLEKERQKAGSWTWPTNRLEAIE